MRALLRAGRADLRHRGLQNLLLFAVVAVATLGITAGLGQQRSAADRLDAAFARANGAHVAFYGDAGTLRKVAEDPDVVQAAGPVGVANASLVHDGASFDDLEVRAAGARLQRVGIPLLFGGRWLSGRDPAEVVVGRSFALAEGIGVGDRVQLRAADETARADLRVVGVALDLVDCFYPECDSQMAWTAPGVVDRLRPRGEPPESLLMVRIADPDAAKAFITRIRRAVGPGIHDLEFWSDTRGNALTLNRFFGAFLAAFGVFLLVAAGIVILSAVSARVLARYRELGVLKALGYTPRQLALVVLASNLAVAAAGAAVGVVAGGLLAPSFQLRMSEVLERGRATFPADVLVGAVLVVLLIVAAATLLPSLRAGRVPASRAIAMGAAQVSTRSSRIAALASRLRLGVPVAVGLKDAGARPLRSWLTVAALCVTVVAIVAALAFDRTVGELADDPALTGDPQGLTVDPRDVPRARVTAALARQPGVASWFTATERQATVGDQPFQASVVGGDLRRAGYVVGEGRMLDGPGEAMIGYGLQEGLGRKVGDRLPLEIAGGRLDLRIVGRYAELEDDGERAIITLADLQRVEPSADPGVFLVRTAAGADRAAVARALHGTVPGVGVELQETDVEIFDAFRAAFYLIAALVLAVALINLVATTVLGIRERMRDIAVLKTLGFTPRQVALSVGVGAGGLAAIAAALGVPAGLLIAAATLETVGREAGIGPEFGAGPAVLGLTVAALGIVVLAAGTGALVARHAARAPVAEVLRAE